MIDNDMPALLRAGTSRGWGIGVVCGGGINCLGVAPDGNEVRFLSFGPLSGDWGGGPTSGWRPSPPPRGAPTAAGRARSSSAPCRRILAWPTRSSSPALSTWDRLSAARLGELAAVVLAAWPMRISSPETSSAA